MKRKMPIIAVVLAVLLAVPAALADDPAISYTINGDGKAETTFEVATKEGFWSAVSTINAWLDSRTVSVGGNDVLDSGKFIISLQANFLMTGLRSGTPQQCVSFSKAGTTTTLLGNGHTVTLANYGATSNSRGAGSDAYFCVKDGVTLNLGMENNAEASSLTITRWMAVSTSGPITVDSHGTVNMYDGVAISDCETGPTFYGAGVTVEGGLFNMHGGEIRNCGTYKGSASIGGGVAVFNGGRFVMDGGTITGCFSQGDDFESQRNLYMQYLGITLSWCAPFTAGGGVVIFNNSTFIMNGGIIENCRANNDPDFKGNYTGGGWYSFAGTGNYGMGGGVALFGSSTGGWLNSAFVMNGGTIRNCVSSFRGGGVAVYGYYTEGDDFDPVIGGSDPVSNVMNEFRSPAAGATPEEAEAVRRAYAPAPGLWINGGTIENCVSDIGGGIALVGVKPDTNVSISNATIANCIANQGGGIHIDGMPSDMEENLPAGTSYDVWTPVAMNDVVITNSVATNVAGGVYYSADSQLSISGANIIKDNALASGAASDLNCQGHEHPFFVSGSLAGSTIGLTDPLLAAGGENSDTFLSSGYASNNDGVDPSAYFFGDHEGWDAAYSESGTEVRLVPHQDAATVELLAVRQRYPWNNIVDIDYSVDGNVSAWTFTLTARDEATGAEKTVAALRNPAATSEPAAISAEAGVHRIAWDANADFVALFATNVIWTLVATNTGEEACRSVVSNCVMDTRRGIRYISDPAADVLPIAYSATNWVCATDEGTTAVCAMPARIEEARRIYHWHNGMTDNVLVSNAPARAGDGSYDYEGGNGGIFETGTQRLELFRGEGEGTNVWRQLCYGLVKLVHSNALGQTVAYLKFADPEFDVTQRELEEQGADDTDREIILADRWLDDFGLNRIDVTPEDVAMVRTELNAFQPNGCREWENMVLGNVHTNLLFTHVSQSVAGRAGVSLPMTDPVSGYGYHVLYELRRADGGWGVPPLQRETSDDALGITLTDAGNAGYDPSGLYRVYSLIVSDDLSVTNVIPSTNVIGVLRVASSCTNTITAVPWVRIGSDPGGVAEDVPVSEALDVAGLSAGDCLYAYDASGGVYYGFRMHAGAGGALEWEPMLNVTLNGITTSGSSVTTLPRGGAFWVTREASGTGRPYFLIGQYDPSAYESAVAGGTKKRPSFALVANPTPDCVTNLVEQLSVESGEIDAADTIVFPGVGGAESTIYFRKDGGWVRKIETVSKNGMVRTSYDSSCDAPPGTGFWYVRRGTGTLKIGWRAWSESEKGGAGE